MPYRDTFAEPVNAKYGAPMGRHLGPDFLSPEAGKIHLRRVPLNSGGYDRGGAYWGLGQPIWHAMDQDGNEVCFRAPSREAAKRHIRETYVDETIPCRFYR